MPKKDNAPIMNAVPRDGMKEKYLVNKEDFKAHQKNKITPNYLQSSDFNATSSKRRNKEIQEKQSKKNFLKDYPGMNQQHHDQ